MFLCANRSCGLAISSLVNLEQRIYMVFNKLFPQQSFFFQKAEKSLNLYWFDFLFLVVSFFLFSLGLIVLCVRFF